jgi:hypothetical protein
MLDQGKALCPTSLHQELLLTLPPILNQDNHPTSLLVLLLALLDPLLLTHLAHLLVDPKEILLKVRQVITCSVRDLLNDNNFIINLI